MKKEKEKEREEKNNTAQSRISRAFIRAKEEVGPLFGNRERVTFRGTEPASGHGSKQTEGNLRP